MGWRRGAVNILLINQYAGSPSMGMEHRPFELARLWTQANDPTTIVLGEHSHLRLVNPALPRSGFCWEEEGVDFCGLKTPAYRSNGLDRARNVTAFCGGLWRLAPWLARELCPGVVIASSTHPFDFSAARRIAQRSGAVLLFELHDLWPLSPMELYGFSKNHPLMRLIDHYERRAIEQADAVISLLPAADRWMAEEGLHPRGYRHLPNGAPTRPEEEPPAEHRAQLEQLKRATRGLVMYAGGFCEANVVEEFAQLARSLPEVGFAAVGEGPLRADLERRHSGDRNLLLLPAVRPGCLPGLLRRADLLWLGTRDLDIYRYGLAMNKLLDYFLAARPVLLAASGEHNPVSAARAGVVVPPGDLTAQRAALTALLALSPAERDALGERGRRHVLEHHDYRRIASDFRRYMEELHYARQRQAP